MKPVLSFFFDALKPSSLEHMPFLNSFAHQRRMRTELGYSVVCHPSMYSGVRPDKHLQWFVWQYSPSTSPFKWGRLFKHLGLVDNVGSRYFLYKTTSLFREKNTAWFGIPLMVNEPLKYWSYFDVVEDRSWDEPGYLPIYPTAFDVLRAHNTGFEIIGMAKGAGDELTQFSQHTFGEIQPWTYFFGSVDGYSHRYGQDAPETIEHLRQLDRLVEAKFEEYSRRISDFDFFCFSDHGHIRVEKQVDIHGIFDEHGHNLHEFITLIDSNYARFWFRNNDEQATVERILATIKEGFTLTPEHGRRYHVNMPDNRYGDLIFYLDTPCIFSKTIWGFSRKQRSMHGYLPENPESDGVFVSNRPMIEGTHVDLVDVLPTLLISLGLPVPDYADGQPLWSEHG
jgi:hypothetical protein